MTMATATVRKIRPETEKRNNACSIFIPYSAGDGWRQQQCGESEPLRTSAEQGITEIAATPHFTLREQSASFLEPRAALPRSCRDFNAGFAACLSWRRGLLLWRRQPYWRTGSAMDTKHEHTAAWNAFLQSGAAAWSMKWPRFKTDGTHRCYWHIERYLPFHNSDALQALRAQGRENAMQRFVLLSWRTKRQWRCCSAARLMCWAPTAHNMTARPPRLGEANTSDSKVRWARCVARISTKPAGSFRKGERLWNSAHWSFWSRYWALPALCSAFFSASRRKTAGNSRPHTRSHGYGYTDSNAGSGIFRIHIPQCRMWVRLTLRHFRKKPGYLRLAVHSGYGVWFSDLAARGGRWLLPDARQRRKR